MTPSNTRFTAHNAPLCSVFPRRRTALRTAPENLRKNTGPKRACSPYAFISHAEKRFRLFLLVRNTRREIASPVLRTKAYFFRTEQEAL